MYEYWRFSPIDRQLLLPFKKPESTPILGLKCAGIDDDESTVITIIVNNNAIPQAYNIYNKKRFFSVITRTVDLMEEH